MENKKAISLGVASMMLFSSVTGCSKKEDTATLASPISISENREKEQEEINNKKEKFLNETLTKFEGKYSYELVNYCDEIVKEAVANGADSSGGPVEYFVGRDIINVFGDEGYNTVLNGLNSYNSIDFDALNLDETTIAQINYIKSFYQKYIDEVYNSNYIEAYKAYEQLKAIDVESIRKLKIYDKVKELYRENSIELTDDQIKEANINILSIDAITPLDTYFDMCASAPLSDSCMEHSKYRLGLERYRIENYFNFYIGEYEIYNLNSECYRAYEVKNNVVAVSIGYQDVEAKVKTMN